MVLDCRLSLQRYPVMLQLQAHLCSLYMRKCSFQIAIQLQEAAAQSRIGLQTSSFTPLFSSRPISSQLLCSKCLSLRLADVNILKLTTSSQNLSAKSFNIPTSCSLDVSLSNYWLHCPQPRGQYRSTALWSQYQKIWTKLTQGMERRLSTSTYAPQTCSIKSQRLVPNIQWFPTCECWS